MASKIADSPVGLGLAMLAFRRLVGSSSASEASPSRPASQDPVLRTRTTVHLCLDAALAEEARNRDHDSSNECEQARKQHVTQEHMHTRASPSLPCAGPCWLPNTTGNHLGGCCCRRAGIALLSVRAGGVSSTAPAIRSYLVGGRRIDYALYLDRGPSQPCRTNSTNFFRA